MSNDAATPSAGAFAATDDLLAAPVDGSSSGVFDAAGAAAAARPIPPPANLHGLGTLTLEEWLSPPILACGIDVPPGFWVDYLASQHSRDDMLAAIAMLSRMAMPSKQNDLIQAVRASCTIDLLRPLDAALAKAESRGFICRQGLLLAAKVVLRRNPLAATGGAVPVVFAAALLCQAVLDGVEPGEMRPVGTDLFPLMDEGLARSTATASSRRPMRRSARSTSPGACGSSIPGGGRCHGEVADGDVRGRHGLDFEAFIELGYMLWAAFSQVPADHVPMRSTPRRMSDASTSRRIDAGCRVRCGSSYGLVGSGTTPPLVNTNGRYAAGISRTARPTTSSGRARRWRRCRSSSRPGRPHGGWRRSSWCRPAAPSRTPGPLRRSPRPRIPRW